MPTEADDGYTVRRLTADDAAGVAACTLECHGAGYPRPDLYSAEAIARRNAAGELISFVALDPRGRLVAHLALEPSASGTVAEMGCGMVLREHRGHRIVERLRDFVVEESRRLRFGGQFVELETGNTAMQVIADRSAARPCGLTLSLWPGSTARKSFIRYFRYVGPRRPAVAHVPPHHEDFVSRIYAELAAPLELGRPCTPAGPERMTVETSLHWQTTFLVVPVVGAGTEADLARAHETFHGDPALRSAYLELPLAQPGTAQACASAERLGFVFSGVCPYGARDGDVLRLQSLKDPAHVDRTKLMNPFARELLDYIVGERARSR